LCFGSIHFDDTLDFRGYQSKSLSEYADASPISSLTELLKLLICFKMLAGWLYPVPDQFHENFAGRHRSSPFLVSVDFGY